MHGEIPEGRCHVRHASMGPTISVLADQSPDPLIGKNFQQHRVGYPTINDVGGVHAVFHRVQGAADLGQHAAVEGHGTVSTSSCSHAKGDATFGAIDGLCRFHG